MADLGGEQHRMQVSQTKAMSHPVRIRILELFSRDIDRAMDAKTLAQELHPDFPRLQLSQVAYHVAVLRDAKLIPAGY